MTKMPVVFIGHGSPMNAIAENRYSKTLNQLGAKLPRPKAILCISAHWMTEGTWATHMKSPKTIHDFYGFPEELFQVQYPAAGSPEIAELTRDIVKDPLINMDEELWGLDHGTWAVLKHMYPKADIPVVQLSLNLVQPPNYHFQLGQKLRELRNHGVLILGSGNIVHNLRRLSWDPKTPGFDWAIEFDEWVKEKVLLKDFSPLVMEYLNTEAGKLSVPTPDHYYPFLYVLGAVEETDQVRFEYEGIENASISMRSIVFS